MVKKTHKVRQNYLGLYTLIVREQKRFTSVWTQTLLAPLVTVILFLSIFSVILSSKVIGTANIPYVTFLTPGILTMVILQNSFANTSSSLLISKVQGNIVDTLLSPLGPIEIVFGYMIGGVLRGLMVASAIVIVIFPFLSIVPEKPFIFISFIILSCIELSLLGILAGILSQKFDHIQALTNFVITPLSFLSGTFYSIKSLPPFFSLIASFNPVFFLIDGVRYGALGFSEGDLLYNLVWSIILCFILFYICAYWISTGFKLKT